MNLSIKEPTLLNEKSIFLNRNFMLLFIGKIISILGDQIYSFALSWYILGITKSSMQMSIFLIINGVVSAIVSPFGGLIADRINRKKILVFMDIVRGIVIIICSGLLIFNLLQIWMLYVGSIILAFCGAVFSPAASALIPNIIDEEQLPQASSMDQFVGSLCTISGMVIGGVLFSLVGISGVFILNALSYLISSIMEASIRLPYKPNKNNEISFTIKEFNKIINRLVEGFIYIKQNGILYYLVAMYAMFYLITIPLIMIYFPYIFNVMLKALPFQAALCQGAGSIGIIIASIFVPFLLKRISLKKSIFWGLSICSCIIFIEAILLHFQKMGCFSNWSMTILFTIAGIIVGISLTFFNVPITVIFQKNTSDEYRGRFWGVQSAIISLTTSIGFLIGGYLAQKIWMGYLFIGTSIFVFVIAVWIVNLKVIKEQNQ